MRSLQPGEVKLSRVYFTEFDRVTYSQVAWTDADVQAIRANLERKLKFLALVKGHVVIAASHLLESELAHDVLFRHPTLFSEGIIVPALRSDFVGFEAFLNAKISEGKESEQYKGPVRREMAQMLDSYVTLSVRWSVSQTSDWFKECLVGDLEDSGSLLRSCFREAGVIVTPDLSNQIRPIPHLSRKDVYLLGKQTKDRKLWDILSNYTDFLYYLFGARAVQSEGILPQENLLDFSLSDMANGRTHLSEMAIFFKIFVDLVKVSTHTHFPTDLLDVLSIEDILDLHKLAIEDRFVEKYNAIQQKTKDGLSIRDPERLVLLMAELEAFEEDLHQEFLGALEKELPHQRKHQKATDKLNFLNTTASLLIPAWGLATGLAEFLVSGFELSRKERLIRGVRNRMEQHLLAWSHFVDKSKLDAKPVLLAFVNRIKERYAARILEYPALK